MEACSGKILVVDDNADARALMKNYLGSTDFVVSELASGVDTIALGSQRLSKYSVIVLDIEMPGKSGWQTARELRDQGYSGYLVACSNFGFTGNAFDFTNKSFDKILRKPYSKKQLHECLKGNYSAITRPAGLSLEII